MRLHVANQLNELLAYPPAHVILGGLEADCPVAAAPISVEELEWTMASLVAATMT